MISIEDCIALCGLDPETVEAIAEHEHVPDICAAALGQYLLRRPHGVEAIRDMIVDDVRAAEDRGDHAHVRQLLHTLQHFLRDHPEARPGAAA